MTKDEVREVISEVLAAEMRQYKLDRETHYQHHEFITSMIKWGDRISSTALKTIVQTVVMGAVGLLVIGFLVWGGHKQ